jgi:hypothetical protein
VVAPSRDKAITGQNIALAADALVPANDIGMSGADLQLAKGIVEVAIADVTLALTGHALTAARGELSLPRLRATVRHSVSIYPHRPPDLSTSERHTDQSSRPRQTGQSRPRAVSSGKR